MLNKVKTTDNDTDNAEIIKNLLDRNVFILHEMFKNIKTENIGAKDFDIHNILSSTKVEVPLTNNIKKISYLEFFFKNDVSGIKEKPNDMRMAYESLKRQLQNLLDMPDSYKNASLIKKQKNLENQFSESLEKYKEYLKKYDAETLILNNFNIKLKEIYGSHFELGKNAYDYEKIVELCNNITIEIPKEITKYLLNNKINIINKKSHTPLILSELKNINNNNNNNSDNNNSDNNNSNDNKEKYHIDLEGINRKNTYLCIKSNSIPVLLDTQTGNQNEELILLKKSLIDKGFPLPKELLKALDGVSIEGRHVTLYENDFYVFELSQYYGSNNVNVIYN